MEPVRLDDLPGEVRVALERSGQVQGVTPSVCGTAPTASWSAWLSELDQDEAVSSIDASAALREARSERSELPGAVVAGDRF
jgi:hypothetical protein